MSLHSGIGPLPAASSASGQSLERGTTAAAAAAAAAISITLFTTFASPDLF